MIKAHSYTVSFTEFPNEISLIFNISNCPCLCEGCSESYLKEDIGSEVTEPYLDSLLEQFKDKYNITLVGFMGGDNDHHTLLQLLKYLKTKWKIKTGFYSGFDYIDMCLLQYLDYYKVGRWIMPKGDPETWHLKACGPMNFPWSNQKLFRIKECKMYDITEEFRKNPLGDLKQYIIID